MKTRKHSEVREYTTRTGYSRTISTYSSVYLFSLGCQVKSPSGRARSHFQARRLIWQGLEPLLAGLMAAAPSPFEYCVRTNRKMIQIRHIKSSNKKHTSFECRSTDRSQDLLWLYFFHFIVPFPNLQCVSGLFAIKTGKCVHRPVRGLQPFATPTVHPRVTTGIIGATIWGNIDVSGNPAIPFSLVPGMLVAAFAIKGKHWCYDKSLFSKVSPHIPPITSSIIRARQLFWSTL